MPDTTPSAGPLDITDATFASTLREHPVVVVDVGADWCPPCHALDPVIDRLAGELAGKVVFAKLDADASPNVPAAFGVQGLPTLLVFRDGSLVGRLVGAAPYPVVRERVLSFAG